MDKCCKQTVYLLVEPVAVLPIWFSRMIDGLKKSCAKNRVSIKQLGDASDVDTLSEKPVSVLVVCSQNNWTAHIVRELKQRKIMPILMGVYPGQFGSDVSGIMMARRIFIEKVVDYFFACGRRKIALVGVNHGASNDNVKVDTFLRTSGQTMQDIYFIDSDILNCVQDCLNHANQYDAVICSNDYIGVLLLAQARERSIRVPEDLFVCGLGNTLIGNYTMPTLTSTAMDEFFEMGKQAVNMWRIFSENPTLTNMTITVSTDIIARGSTAYIEPGETQVAPNHCEAPAVSIGTESQQIRNLENCLRGCDELDIDILHALLSGKSNDQIEEELFLAHSSLYYRLKKLYQMTNVASRGELEELFQKYLPNFSLDNANASEKSGIHRTAEKDEND